MKRLAIALGTLGVLLLIGNLAIIYFLILGGRSEKLGSIMLLHCFLAIPVFVGAAAAWDKR